MICYRLSNRYLPLFTGGQFPFNEGAQIQLIIKEKRYSSFEGSSYIARAIKKHFGSTKVYDHSRVTEPVTSDDVIHTFATIRSYRHLEGIKPNPNPNPNPKIKLLQPANYHFPNGECPSAFDFGRFFHVLESFRSEAQAIYISNI